MRIQSLLIATLLTLGLAIPAQADRFANYFFCELQLQASEWPAKFGALVTCSSSSLWRVVD